MPPKTLFRLGLGFLFEAVIVYFCSGRWLKTRIFEPLDFPVTLDTREIKTPPFQINLRESYFVALHVDDSVDSWHGASRCGESNLLGSEWRVYVLGSKPGQPPALWASSGKLTQFYELYGHQITAPPGQYELVWDLPASAACLDRRRARLMVYAGAADYEQGVAFIQIFCIFLGGAGAVLALVAVVRVLRRRLVIGEAPRCSRTWSCVISCPL